MFKKVRSLSLLVLSCILLSQPTLASWGGRRETITKEQDKTYFLYKVFDVTNSNRIGWRRVWCRYDCDLVIYGGNDDWGPGIRDDEAELLSNHKASLVGIDNDHARSSTWQTADDDGEYLGGPKVYGEDGRIKISDDEEPAWHYYIYTGSPWLEVVKEYAKNEDNGIGLVPFNSPRGDVALYVASFDPERYDANRFQQYLYEHIPANALYETADQVFDDTPIGIYIVTARYPNGQKAYIGDAGLIEKQQTITLEDENTQTTITIHNPSV